MTQSTKFTWIPFFEEFADKLLEYKDDRSLLINKLETIFENFGKLPFPRHGKDDIVFDIDPFTVFAFINRGISDKNRITLSEEIIKEFNLSSSAPLEFTGIPVANNRSLYFTGGKDNIDKLWDVFSRALVFSKDNSDNNKEAFSSSFDIALEIKGIKWNLTMGLFWIRPNTYLALDGKNREYIEQHTNLQRVIGEDYLDENKVPTGLEYLKICDNFTEAFKSDELEFNNFPDELYLKFL